MSLQLQQLTVAVIGATGTQGGAVVDLLLKRGHHVRALTRNPQSKKAKALQNRGVDVYFADLANEASLLSALQGADAVFGMTTPFDTDAATEARLGKVLVDTAKKADIAHFVFSSAANADRYTGIPHLDSKYAVEQHLIVSDTPWTIIGPAAFMDDFNHGWYKRSIEEGELTMVMPADVPLKFVCCQDIAAISVLAFEQPERFTGKRIDIAGDSITGSRIAVLLSQKLGRRIGYKEVPLAIAETYSRDLATMFTYFQTTGLDIDISALRTTYPEIAWHTFAEWLDSQSKLSIIP